MIVTRTMAFIGFALPFAIILLSDASDFGFVTIHWVIEPWKLILASFSVALCAFLPLINQTFKNYSTWSVCIFAAGVLVIHFALAVSFGWFLFMIGGDTI